MSELKKNFIYNIAYQLLLLVLPIVTVPYVSRVLGVDGIGIYSYTYSIVYYFMIITLLGINNYGNRTIAQVRDNKEKKSKAFLEIYTIQLMTGLFMLFLYLMYVFFFSINYKTIALIQSIYIISAFFDINWFFFGIEKFKVTVIRSTILKIISLICIFLFVKSNNDIWIYTTILSGSTLLSQLLLIPFLKKEIDLHKISFKDVKKHIKPCLILFIPVIAISLYKIMDKIMLGMFTTVTEVGYYEQAEKIINIPLGIVTALGTVMLPRISNLVAKKEKKEILKYIDKSINFMMFLAFPIFFGLITISKNFVPLFMGNDFDKTSILVNYLSITLLFISFANVIRKQWLVPNGKDKTFTVSVILGAIINLLINYLLIPKYNSIGACIGTIIAEFSVMIYQIIYVHNELPIVNYLKSISKFLITSIFMFIIIYTLNYLKMNDVIRLVLQVVIGIIVYFSLNNKYILSIIKKRK